MSFVERVSEFTAEFEAEYFVLEVIDDGRRKMSSTRSSTPSNVRLLLDGDERAVTNAIARLLDKQVIGHDGDTLRLRTTESNSGAE